MGTFTADIEAFVAKSEARVEAVVKNSIKDVMFGAQLTRGEGGRMRYDTGFLSASGRASLDGLPTGVSVRPADAAKGQYKWNGEASTAVLLNMKIGQPFYFGWVANYAETRELYDGFLGTAVQNWQQYVKANSERFRDK